MPKGVKIVSGLKSWSPALRSSRLLPPREKQPIFTAALASMEMRSTWSARSASGLITPNCAKIALVSHLLGNEQPLDEKEVEKLHEVRHRYSGRGNPAPPHRPVAADDLQADDLQSGLQSGGEPKQTADSPR